MFLLLFSTEVICVVFMTNLDNIYGVMVIHLHVLVYLPQVW
jgi:hypothetical protein